MRTLYPPIEPNQSGMLPVSDRHTLYWEECGNPDGKPVVMLHGGPGGGCNAAQVLRWLKNMVHNASPAFLSA